MGTFEEIWDIVRRIPPGRVATYGQIARRTGRPRGARLVGWAMAACPAENGVPCHRVVDRSGGTKKAFDEHMPGGQRFLLEAEGVVFRTDGTVDMDCCQWRPAL